jgi:hypothetical protein
LVYSRFLEKHTAHENPSIHDQRKDDFSKLMMNPPPPKGRPRGESVTEKNLKNLPDPPCLGEVLRWVSLQIFNDLQENTLKSPLRVFCI